VSAWAVLTKPLQQEVLQLPEAPVPLLLLAEQREPWAV
jgi:hypothetical protein